jgi:hypothetical protein
MRDDLDAVAPVVGAPDLHREERLRLDVGGELVDDRAEILEQLSFELLLLRLVARLVLRDEIAWPS